MTTLHPIVLWAQRKDKLFLTIDVQDCKSPEITIENDENAKSGRVKFQGKAHSHATGPEEHQYVLDLELFDEIDKEDVKQGTTDRTITLVIAKKNEGPYWPRLLKATGKTPLYVKADWDKWVDEDEEDEVDAGGMGGFDMSALQQFQGMGGMGGAMGGAGGFDLSQLGDLAGLQGMAGGDDEEDGSGDDEELPSLVEK